MRRKILLYRWGSLSEPELELVFQRNNIEYCVFTKRVEDYHADAKLAAEFLQVLHGEQVEAVFSFDYKYSFYLQQLGAKHRIYFPLAADAVGMEVSARERESVLKVLGEYFDVDLYSGFKLPSSLQGLKIREKGFADYEKEMIYIFHNSKINLNITSKTIESGIPLRVFDILSCSSFCLTNYQPEVAQYFVAGEDLVVYYSMKDLVMKAAYYMEYGNEREQIDRNGYEKLKKNHELGIIVEEMLKMVL